MASANRPRPTRGEHRFNDALTALLLVAIAVVVNLIARDRLAFRRDLSEDQLYALSPAAEAMLGELEDVLQVKAYFTGEARHGPVQIAKGRLLDLLREMRAASGGRMTVELADPNTDSEARLQAARYGIAAVPMQAVSGSAVEVQQVYLGLVLRYRGRERAIPFVLPQGFEYAFASELRRLLRDRPPVVGFLSTPSPLAALLNEPEKTDSFQTARELLAVDYTVRDLVGLAEGDAIGEDVDVVVVPRPAGLHPRAVFALDQFLQRGGRILVALDREEVDVQSLTPVPLDSGLGDLLAAWGIAPEPGVVWDRQCNSLTYTRKVYEGGKARPVKESVEYPLWPAIRQDGLAAEVPATARLDGVALFWAAGLATREVPGLETTPLVWSSERSWVVGDREVFTTDFETLNAVSAELLSRGNARSHTLAVAVAGSFPSPFARHADANGEEVGGAPAPRDPVQERIDADRRRAAAERGEEPPPVTRATTDEEVLSRAADSQVVVVGDSDWMRDGQYFSDRNQLLFRNLVDWLALEEGLMALRSRIPKERAITDFLEQERERLGLARLEGSLGWDEAEQASQNEELAHDRAAARRRTKMLLATGGSLAAALGLALVHRLRSRRGFPGVFGGLAP